MRIKFILALICMGFTCTIIQAQEQSEEAFFEVTFDAFTPPTQELIRSFEGKEPMPFLAKDVDGVEHFLKDYKGKVVFIYFWNGQCTDCLAQVASLNLLQKEEKDRLQIISFVDEAREEATILAKSNGVEFPVLTNGVLLGEAAYGIELGYPRLFALDESGKVIQVLPEETLKGKGDIYLELKSLFRKIANK